MKKIITLILFSLLFVVFIGCENYNGSNYKFSISIVQNYNSSTIYCDSVQMISKGEALIWIDGTKMNIKSDRILIYSNSNSKKKNKK